MNKKIKIVSTVALASLLTLNVFNVKALATKIEEKAKTQIYGAYEEIKDLKNVVPVILESSTTDLASDFDKTTFAEIKEVYPTATDFSGNEDCVATGDTFKIGEESYTILVYGDVNKDGKISSLDAIEIQKYSIGMNDGIESIQLLAADVDKIDNKVNSAIDAVAIRDYSSRKRSTVVSEVTPDLVEAGTSINSTIEIGEDNLINATEIEKSLTIKATLTELYSENKDLEVRMYKAEDSKTNILDGKNVKIHFNGTQKESSVTLEKAKTYTESLDNYDGTVKIELWDGDVLVGIKEIEVHTIKPSVDEVLVSTNRINSSEATANFTYFGENKVGKILYYVGEDEKDTIDNLNESYEFSSNKIEKLKVSTDLKTKKAYKLSYAVEDVYGNQSGIKTVVISKDAGNVEQRHAVTELKTPDVSKEEKKLTWKSDEDLSGAKIRVTIYNGEEVIEVNETIDGKTANSDYELDITKYLESAGEYKFEVVVLGDEYGDYSDSEAVTSDVIKIEALKPVTDITFEVTEDGKYKLSWKDEQNDKENIEKYTVKLVKKSDAGETTVNDEKVDAETCTATLETSEIEKNEVYTAIVIANSKNKLFIDSEETSSEEFFVINLEEIGLKEAEPNDRGENYITLELTNPEFEINEKTPTYKLKIYKVVEKTSLVPGESMTDVEEVREDNVILDENNKIKVDGLDPDTKYAFKLIATFDDVTGESDFVGTSQDIKTLKVAPKIENLTYSSSKIEGDEAEETFYFNESESKVYIDGEEYDLNGEYTKEFKDLAALVGKIKLYDGDIIKSATLEKISIELTEKASTESDYKVVIPEDMAEDAEIEITGNDLSRTIVVNEKANVTLVGEKAIFAIEGDSAKKITVTDGVTVNGNATYTIESNATINDVDVTVSQETEMKANDSEFEVTVDGESKTDYTFASKAGAKGVVVSFVSKNGNLNDRQLGKVTILSKGTVKVTSDQVSIGGKIDVEVEGGEANVDISNSAILDKTLTLKKGATGLKVKAKNKAPANMSKGVSVDITDEELTEQFAGKEDAVRAYLDSFNLKGTGAKIKVGDGKYDVTITLEKPLEKDVEIGNI